ncbi:phosphotransferase family protein [Streptomyces roseolilacinus]|uniref:phosphotransferase family protein n=1 Tax=Streptomyces roseolilacinus TaxID=66904 RepID=UPI0037F70136
MDIIDEHLETVERLLPDEDGDGLLAHRGQFHDVVVGAERVICFARTDAAGARLPERAAVLRSLAELDLGFRTPVPLDEGREPEPYLVLSRVPGSPLDAAELADPRVLRAAAAQFARLLRGLARAGSSGIAGRTLPHTAPNRWQEFAAGVREELFPLMSDAGRERAGRELDALDSLPHLTSAVVHGDLGGENVLWETVDGLPRLNGVVDWDEVAMGDQAVDLAAIQASYGEELVRKIVEHEAGSLRQEAERVPVIRGTFALQQALFALRDGDRAELDDGLLGYR